MEILASFTHINVDHKRRYFVAKVIGV